MIRSDAAAGSLPDETDVVVLGGGAAGMSTALFAALKGLKVLLVEKAGTVGGTTASSAGTTWIPGSLHASSVEPVDTRADAEAYLETVVGEDLDRKKLDAFLQAGPRAIAELEAGSEVKFRARPHHPDYHSNLPGATLRGRALEPLPFDGRRLGRDLRLLRRPLPELTLGGMMVGPNDILDLRRAHRSIGSALRSASLIGRHGLDLLRFGRGSRLLMGNALCARLLYSLRQQGVALALRTPGARLLIEGDRVAGITVASPDGVRRVHARLGVVLATGGFTHSERLQDELLPTPRTRYSATPRDVAGDGVEFGLEAGGQLANPGGMGAFWAPVSVRQRRGGIVSLYPHFFLDRGKPGFLAVDRTGQRFVNEAPSYDGFVRAMYARGPEAVPCFLVADARAVERYGIGLVLPGGWRLRRLLREGYLKRSDTIEDLAHALSVPPKTLAATVSRFNEAARRGVDEDFHRGGTAANLVLGDPSHGPNPCLGPLEKGPFYGIALHPGMNGTSAGLVTDIDGRVLGTDGRPMAGLFACGNDSVSMMGGSYPGPGTTIGPAIAFAYRVAQALRATA